MTPTPPPKRDVMLALLQQAESVFVNFDPRREGVILPAHLKRQPRVVLQYGLNMRIPIPDLEVGEDGIGATLSFDRSPTWTFVPWSAVFAIVSQDQRGMLWESDMPREIETEPNKKGPAEAAKQPPAAKGPVKKGAAKRPTLRAVDGGQSPRTTKPAEPSDSKLDDVEPVAAADATPEPAPAPPAPVPARDAEPARAVTPAPAQASEADAPASQPARDSDEIVEIPAPEPKKKRELPPWLRVVK